MENDTFIVEVEVTTQNYETVQFTFSQKTLDKCNYKNKDELLEGIRSGDFEPFDWSEEEHWHTDDSEIKRIFWEEAKHVV